MLSVSLPHFFMVIVMYILKRVLSIQLLHIYLFKKINPAPIAIAIAYKQLHTMVTHNFVLILCQSVLPGYNNFIPVEWLCIILVLFPN